MDFSAWTQKSGVQNTRSKQVLCQCRLAWYPGMGLLGKLHAWRLQAASYLLPHSTKPACAGSTFGNNGFTSAEVSFSLG